MTLTTFVTLPTTRRKLECRNQLRKQYGVLRIETITAGNIFTDSQMFESSASCCVLKLATSRAENPFANIHAATNRYGTSYREWCRQQVSELVDWKSIGDRNVTEFGFGR